MTPYYEDSLITLYNCDCEDYMAECEDKQFELAIVDPPFFDGPNTKGYYDNRSHSDKPWKKSKYKTLLSWDIPDTNYYNLLKKITKDQIIWGINYFEFVNLTGPGRIIWDKKNDESTFSKAEIASCSLIESVQMIRYTWNGMIQENMKEKEIRIHCTQKPVALYRWLLQNYAKPNDTIFDSHAGSCSLAIACHDLGFKLVACEIDKDYLDAAVNRIKNYLKQPKLFKPPAPTADQQRIF